MIICVTGLFDVYDRKGDRTGTQEFVVSHGIDSRTGLNVILPNEHPARLSARFDRTLIEWVLDEPEDS